MNNLDLTQTGGLWASEDTLDFLQQANADMIIALASALGDNVIVSGCVITGTTIGDGYVVTGGELLKFKSSTLATYIQVKEDVTSEQFEDGTQKGVYKTRYAQTSSLSGVAYASFVRLQSLKAFAGMLTKYSSDYSVSKNDTLATIEALYNLNAALKNQVPSGVVVMWSGLITAIPAGWRLCDGNNDTPDLREKFIMGAGGAHAIGDTGGEAQHTLTKGELPAAGVGYKDRYYGEKASSLSPAAYKETMPAGFNDKIGSSGSDTDNDTFLYINATTDNLGSGQPHENRPPFYTLAYIIKI